MIKFESYLANNRNNNKNNTAIIENYTSSMPYLSLYDYTLFIWEKVTKVVSCYIISNLTTIPMPKFWVGNRI